MLQQGYASDEATLTLLNAAHVALVRVLATARLGRPLVQQASHQGPKAPPPCPQWRSMWPFS